VGKAPIFQNPSWNTNLRDPESGPIESEMDSKLWVLNLRVISPLSFQGYSCCFHQHRCLTRAAAICFTVCNNHV
jgi:hypothetical protein